MNASVEVSNVGRYARCIAASKRAHWEIDADVIRGRTLDPAHKFLPDGLTRASDVDFLSQRERVFLSQVQGRTYANMFGLVERFINAKVLEISRDYWLDQQIALEALVRFSEEELKHQELFRRVNALAEHSMPDGYRFLPDPNDVARVVLGTSTWAVLALTCLIELFTQVHYKESIAPDYELSPLYKDVFLFHWKEESQHAVLDELEWLKHDALLNSMQREQAVTDLILLVGAVDGILQSQASSDVTYYIVNVGRSFSASETERLRALFLNAYRFQYIFSGLQSTRFPDILNTLVNANQMQRITQALAPLASA